MVQIDTSHVTFTCSVNQGDPSPTIEWSFNGQGLPLLNNSKHFVTGSRVNSSLTVFNITLFDAGEYSCVVDNILGSSNSSATLQVEGVWVGLVVM